MSKQESKFYDPTKLLDQGALINFIFGERGNGKTYAFLKKIVQDWYESEGLKRGAYIRQIAEHIRGALASQIFESLVANGEISRITNGEWDRVVYRAGKFYMARDDEQTLEVVTCPEPFCFAFSVNQSAKYKSASFPNIYNIVFDEFIPIDGRYLPDEANQFQHIISTIVREKDNARIFLVGNSTNWTSPYFNLYGVKGAGDMVPGELKVITQEKRRNTGELMIRKIAVEFTESTEEKGGKASDIYFMEGNAESSMITGGGWVIQAYPQNPHPFTREHVKLTFWVDFDKEGPEVIRGRLVKLPQLFYLYIETVPRKLMSMDSDEKRDVFYRQSFSPSVNHLIDPLRPGSYKPSQVIATLIQGSRIFAADGRTGANFVSYCYGSAHESFLNLS